MIKTTPSEPLKQPHPLQSAHSPFQSMIGPNDASTCCAYAQSLAFLSSHNAIGGTRFILNVKELFFEFTLFCGISLVPQ